MLPLTILICHEDEGDRTVTQAVLDRARVWNTLKFVRGVDDLLDYLFQRVLYGGEMGAAPRPGLILLDLRLLDGERAALETIHRDPSLGDIPIIGIAATTSDELRVRGYDLGVNHFVTKPLTVNALMNTISTLDRLWLEIIDVSPVVP